MAPKHLSEVFGSSKHNSAPNYRNRESNPSTQKPEPQNSGRSSKRRASQKPKFPEKLRFISLVAATYLVVTAGTFIVGSPFTNAQSVRQRATLSSTDSSTVFQLRSFPDGPVSTYGRVGDSGEILDTHRGNDGYTWYYVRFPSTPRGAWVRADAVTLGNSANPGSSQTVTRPSPSTGTPNPPAASPSLPSQPVTPIPSSVGGQPQGSPQYATTGPIGTPPSSPPVQQRPRFNRPSLTNRPATPAQPPRTASVSTAPLNQETIDYFLEIALGSEWGNSSSTIRRWTQNLRIQPMGTPSQADRQTLETVISELNQLTNGQVNLQIVQENPNVQIYFVPEAEFSRYEPNYVPRNLGFFWARWNNSGIYNSRILISTTGVSQTERSHLIREELTQSLGLMRDSYRYEDSIFQQRWTQTNQFSDLDRAIIQLLYRPDIRPGMSREEVLAQLGR